MTSNVWLYDGKDKTSMGMPTNCLNEMRDTQTRQKKPRVDREVIPQPNAPIRVTNWNSSQQSPLKTYASSSFNVRFVTSENNQNGDNIVEIPIDVVRKGSIPYEHTLYGFFIGEKAPFDVVNDFACDMWKVNGIMDVFMNDSGFFFFKFDSEHGMIKVVENSPWMIRNMPIFIRQWEPGLGLEKLCQDKVPIWVKLYDVPLELWTDDGLSYISSKLGVPIAVDSRTARMCENPSGWMAYARVLIELSAETAWKDEILLTIPKLNGHDKSVSTVHIEYACLPPSCSVCKIFGHSNASCHRHFNSNTLSHDFTSFNGKCNEGFIAESKRGGNNVKVASLDTSNSTANLYQPMPTTTRDLLANINSSPIINEREKRCVVKAEEVGALLTQNPLVNLPERISRVNYNEDMKPGTCDGGAHIHLKVKGQDGNVCIFTMKMSTKLKKLMNAFRDRHTPGLEFSFLYDGWHLKGEETPVELKMVEGDEIDVILHQKGC